MMTALAESYMDRAARGDSVRDGCWAPVPLSSGGGGGEEADDAPIPLPIVVAALLKAFNVCNTASSVQ